MEDTDDNLTIKDVAKRLRCSKAHVQKRFARQSPGNACSYSPSDGQAKNRATAVA